MSAFQRTMPLFFSFGKVNYARWDSLYYEDCFKLKEKHPSVFESFVRSPFVVQHGDKNFRQCWYGSRLGDALQQASKRTRWHYWYNQKERNCTSSGIIKHDTHANEHASQKNLWNN